MKIANKNARQHVQNLDIFKGSNLFSEMRGKYYVVFSYGYHYPMLVYNKLTNGTGTVTATALVPQNK